MGGSASWSAEDEPAVAFNQVLSEILDVVQVAKQADRKVHEPDPLHGELDRLLGDVVGWARRLMEEDDAHGISAFAFMPSQAGRHPRAAWLGAPTDDEVRKVLDDLLAELEQHLTAALAQQADEGSRGALAAVARELRSHRRALAGDRPTSET